MYLIFIKLNESVVVIGTFATAKPEVGGAEGKDAFSRKRRGTCKVKDNAGGEREKETRTRSVCH